MGEWIVGAVINLIGSVAINFGTNLLKLGHDERERLSMPSSDESERYTLKPIVYFRTWRVGAVFFAIGNCLNFISFGYAAQSLLAALGSIQFVSNIAFSYFVLDKTVTMKVITATTFIVFGNVFLVSFGNHQSPVYTPEQLTEKYSNIVFLIYCLILLVVVAVNHYIYRKGEDFLSVYSSDMRPYWRLLLPFSYAIVSGAVGSCSVLFAKSLSNLLRLAMSSNYQLHSWFTYSMLLLFLSTAGFWMTRLNEGLSLFDAILIVPMFQIAWAFFSICTGFVYFQEYQVFDGIRITMFVLGMSSVFIGISLLAPDDSKDGSGRSFKDSSFPSSLAQGVAADINRLGSLPKLETASWDRESFWHVMQTRTRSFVIKAKAAGALSLGLGEESINASSVLVMPMMSSRANGFRGSVVFDRTRLSLIEEGSSWSKDVSMDIADEEDDVNTGTALLFPHGSAA